MDEFDPEPMGAEAYDKYVEQEAKKLQKEDPEGAGKMDLEDLKLHLKYAGA